MKRLITPLILVLFLFSLLLTQCDKQESAQSPSTTPNKNQASSMSAGNCGTCISGIPDKTNCPCAACIDDLMKGKSTKVYTVTWNTCENGCDPGNTTSTITYCYTDPFDCCAIAMQIDNPPSCLPCVPNPMCIMGSVDCQTNGVSFTYRDPDTQNEYVATFVADPKFKLTCRDTTGASYTCEGDANEQ